jgi:hypothetical protein
MSDIAYFNEVAFPFQPNSVEWNYNVNKASFDTVGGRVTQILSIKIGTMTWQGDAGSRHNLINLYSSFKETQNQQIETETSSSLQFNAQVGSNLPNQTIKVWARSMEVGWDYQSVTYPYRIQFEVDEDFGQITSGLTAQALDRLAENINWNPDYSGLVKGKIDVNIDPKAAIDQLIIQSNPASQPSQGG